MATPAVCTSVRLSPSQSQALSAATMVSDTNEAINFMPLVCRLKVALG